MGRGGRRGKPRLYMGISWLRSGLTLAERARRPSLHSYSLLFGGGEEYQNFELFLDVVETMLQRRFNEDD
jgi:hypothetical protein